MNKTILSAASSYNQKYYFNDEFKRLPPAVRNEIKILTVTTAERLRGIFSIGFYDDGSLFFEAAAEELDLNYDEIGAPLEIKRIQNEKADLISSLRMFYKYAREDKNVHK